MYRILVPLDFYKTSFAAFNYAANFSKLFPNVEIVLLHVINGPFDTENIVIFDPMLDIHEAAVKRLTILQEEYAKKVGIKLPSVDVRKEAVFGLPETEIYEYAKSHRIDMIIMGTRDKHNIFDKVLGSASATTVRKAHCPVMLIHENVKYNTPEKIVFAFDEKSDIQDALERYWKLNSVLKAKTDFVHVNGKKKDNVSYQKAEIVEELFEDNVPSFSFEIKTIEGVDVHAALKDYCLFEKADILVMMHRKEGVFKNIFGTHHAVKMAQEFHLPVLVFHEGN
ncbi:MAG: nucleotide-binding universal stress UspA family protein [Saprospiraceae bacterium]|jgi:nucleotide-binding universal stress UspA family protein